MPTQSPTPSLTPDKIITDLFLEFGDPTMQQAAGVQAAPKAGLNPTQGFAEGGLVQPPQGGVPPVDMGVTAPNAGPGLQAPGGAPQGGADMEAEAKQLLQQQPEMVQQMLAAAQEAMAQGEFTEEMIKVGGKMAIVVSKNPAMYPKMLERLTAMGAKDLPPEYDPEFIFTVILMGMAWEMKDQGGAPAAAADTSATPAPDFRDGGYVTHGSNAADGGAVVGAGGPRDDKINADLSNGEFVIPAHAVRDFGVEHFQKRYIEAYKGKPTR